jgi:ribonuclease HI
MGETLVLYTDGASRGNPGPAGIGAALYRVEDGRLAPVGEVSEGIGVTTNNVAEYRAVVAGLQRAAELAPERLVLRADSQLLIRQLQGRYRVKAENLRPLYEQARQLLKGIPSVALEHVPREDNTVADALANAALDG